MQSLNDIELYLHKNKRGFAMIRKILESLPFIHHQPPLNMPLRKAVIMAIQRPVNIKQIEDFLFKRLNKNGETVIQELEEAIFYLRKERFFKRDSSNLFNCLRVTPRLFHALLLLGLISVDV